MIHLKRFDDLVTYAIGDVHGRYDLMQQILKQIRADAAEQPHRIIFLGDYVDRGPDSRKVVEAVMEMVNSCQPDREIIALTGNHEQMMLDAVSDGSGHSAVHWLKNGGVATMQSYGLDYWDLHKLPMDHLKFLHALPRTVDNGVHFFCHAGVNPNFPLDQQDEEEIIWIRDKFLNSDKDFGRIIVHGHTIFEAPQQLHNRLSIDTGAYHTGNLTAVALDPANPEPRFIQATTRQLSDDFDPDLAEFMSLMKNQIR